MAKAYNVQVRVAGLTPQTFSLQTNDPSLAIRRALQRFDFYAKQRKAQGSVAAITVKEAVRKGFAVTVDILGVVELATGETPTGQGPTSLLPVLA
jgi:hypothetical protein